MPIINCPDCGHLKMFHHEVREQGTENGVISSCTKEVISGCHATIVVDKDNWTECECAINY